MSVGLLGLLDDVAALAKVAAASLDDVAGMAMKAGLKASGAVIDDAAVTRKSLRAGVDCRGIVPKEYSCRLVNPSRSGSALASAALPVSPWAVDQASNAPGSGGGLN